MTKEIGSETKMGIDWFSFILGALCGYLLFAIVALIIAEAIDHNK